ncbi:hypothetical protein [Anianabacter salinae]|uniref:hypothetical protein n=1 Tax=Anianabacter salinae TaxID=2851023 RepID=UPI00225E460A|nr:hypothetical protein [Anianabacter salinae]MBV0912932.1 hypothetical protein [Anianabacter salinae]
MIRFAQSVLARLSAPTNLSVRETYWGYTIETGKQIPRHYLLSGRAIFLALFYASWLVMLGAWLALLSSVTSAALVPGFVLLWLAVAFAFWRLMLRQVGVGHIVQVDLARETLRVGARCGDTKDQECQHIPFGEIGDLVMEHPRDPGVRQALKLRRKQGGVPVLIATGDEASLLALHDRLSHDLTPIEQRMASYRQPRTQARPVFPPLGPSEISA